MSPNKQLNVMPHKPFVLWLTGYSGAGKSTIAKAVSQRLNEYSNKVYLLDGDVVRKGLCSDLTFSDTDRDENIRRVAEVAKLALDSGSIVLAALISPKQAQRQQARHLFKEGEFIEAFIDTAFTDCEKRDVKGLYKKARLGEIKNFTGIDSKYEAPMNAQIHIRTAQKTVNECVNQVFDYLYAQQYITK